MRTRWASLALLVAVGAAGCGTQVGGEGEPAAAATSRTAAIRQTPSTTPSPTPVLDIKAGEACTLTDSVVAGRDAPGWSGDKQERFHLWGAMFGGWLRALTAAMESENEELSQMGLNLSGGSALATSNAPPLSPDSAANPEHVDQLVSWCLAHDFAQPHSSGEAA
ncbi:hypothetical protein MXD62_22955 [Frankia sp. Mgl5]|uniref:hypothetical protein n=1 Tax=Frankia sp. Mgl5 TaxID=2933793 RepID=UPI00200DEC52|nr:hypothetical protein [Frankia sp. Mgl5]MCK9929989.1 hypothetical protein [Frankia sp. Mgl5]